MFKHYSSIIQALFKHYPSIIQALFKHYSSIIQALSKHYSSIIRAKCKKKITAITYSTRLFRINSIIVPPLLNNFDAQEPFNPVWNVINQKYTVRDALTNEVLLQ